MTMSEIGVSSTERKKDDEPVSPKQVDSHHISFRKGPIKAERKHSRWQWDFQEEHKVRPLTSSSGFDTDNSSVSSQLSCSSKSMYSRSDRSPPQPLTKSGRHRQTNLSSSSIGGAPNSRRFDLRRNDNTNNITCNRKDNSPNAGWEPKSDDLRKLFPRSSSKKGEFRQQNRGQHSRRDSRVPC